MRTKLILTQLLAIAALLTLATTAAQAKLVRPATSFTPTGVTELGGIAVDNSGDASTGDVYVTGEGSGNVEKFSASGVPETSFVSPAFNNPEGVAVDNSSDASKGDIYVANSYEQTVDKLEPSGKEVAGFAITPSSIPAGDPGAEKFQPHGVAVDPANGNVIVADGAEGDHEVDIFSSSGVFISQFHAPGELEKVAIGPGSEIFTATSGGGASEWSPPGYTTSTPVGAHSTHGLGVDLATGNVLVDEGKAEPGYIAEYAGTLGSPLLEFGSGHLEESNGVAVNETTNTVYATVPRTGLVELFGAPEELAEAVTGTPATGVTGTSADVSGSVAPGGLAVTSCRFEYGLSESYGANHPCSQAPPLTGTAAIPVSGSLEGLQPDETYHYRLVAVDAHGSAYGEDETFQTEALPPSLANESVSGLAQTSATLNAGINPNDQETTYHFEYGATTAYGTVLPAPDASIGSGYGDVNVAQQLTGLQPGTTYHFRVIATNATSSSGGTVGPDETFTTPPLQPPVVSTGQAQGVAQNAATLTGTIDTQGQTTVYEFDLGTDTSYGTRIYGYAGYEPGSLTYSISLQNLVPGVTYHYRIVATNVFGTTYGADQTFTTSTYPSATLTGPTTPPLVATTLLVSLPAETKTTTIAPTTTTKTKCKKGEKLSHGKCVKNTSKKKSKAKKAKKASHDRRTTS
jgi:hypothetical protein